MAPSVKYQLLAALFAAVAVAPGTGRAQAPLVCGAQNVGQHVCQAEGICQCAYFAGGLMFRDPPGYRWDCSLTQGKCLAGEDMPVLSRAVVPLPVVPGGRRDAAPKPEPTTRCASPRPISSAMATTPAPPTAWSGRAPALPSPTSSVPRASTPTGALDHATVSRLRS